MSAISSQGFVNFAQPVIDKNDLVRVAAGLPPAVYSFISAVSSPAVCPSVVLSPAVLSPVNSFDDFDNSVCFGDDFGSGVFALGCAAPLDLSIGHLKIMNHDYSVVSDTYLNGSPKGWFVHKDWAIGDDFPFVAKFQPFKAGGYEVVLVRKDLKAIANLLDAPRKTGKREKHDDIEWDNVKSSMERAKRKARFTIKNLGCDRLLTLTRRETDPDYFCTLEQWAADWSKFCKLVKKLGVELSYVAVLEPHKKGNFHLHAAVTGRLPINQLRGIWWAICGGRGLGNIDISFKQNVSDAKRRAGVARYVSKYITKQYEAVGSGVEHVSHVDFNKKRYWASRTKLPELKKIIMRSADFLGAVRELAGVLCLDVASFLDSAWKFRDDMGLWFNFDDSGGGFVSGDVPF